MSRILMSKIPFISVDLLFLQDNDSSSGSADGGLPCAAQNR